jgi:hypothetical protein
MFRLHFAVLISCLAFWSNAALAQSWQGTIQKDDFGDKDTGIALVQSSLRGFGIRCIKGERPAIVFLTRETWADGLELVPAKLLLRIDENEPFDLPAELESYDGGNAFRQATLVRVVAEGGPVSEILQQIESARGRLSVAVELAEQRFEPTRFSAKGSSKALAKIRPLCNFEPD